MKRWFYRALLAVGVWGVALGYAALTDRTANYVPLAAAIAAVLTVIWLCADAYSLSESPHWMLYRAPPARRSFDPRFSRLSQELTDAADRQAASLALHTNLTAVAEQILLDRYGIDSELSPDRARDLLGADVDDYLRAQPGNAKVVFSPTVFTVLDRLESL